MRRNTSHRLPQCSYGFTLLEVVLFILIVILIVGALVPAITHALADGGLRKTATEFEKNVRKAHEAAMISGQPSQIIFDKQGVTMQESTDENSENPDSKTADKAAWSEGVQVKIRPWPEREWRSPEEWIWVFQPSGLVSPLEIRFEKGKYWIEQSFSPLTAEMREERYYLP